ncbi:uncharacterized protein LOC122027729 isoform X1 [Zingiber officinale]|uniref:uncharacterized protein LOC122027729 isoform X1 n=1 Tax=Zingiber officinale TaxID=94328 RepID=UPI001C4B25A8|nr:uncharacterized protein LOC122027729 isoform X1 [Zingiber officinale]
MSKLSSGGTAAGASSNKSSEGWKKRIIVPTVLAGVVGGGVGLISKHRKALGVGTTAASFAANFAIVTGCYYKRKNTHDKDAGAAVSETSNPETTIPVVTTINKEKAIMVYNLHMTHGSNSVKLMIQASYFGII